MARRSKGTAGDDPNQLNIDWNAAPVAASTPAAILPPVQATEPLVQRLPWDFESSFPPPLDAAIDAGLLDESDREPGNLRSLHHNYMAQCLATLKERDITLDARRKQIDPKTGHKPNSHAGRERLRKYLDEEPARLDRTFEVLIGTYGESFGPAAEDAFRKAVIARHAGITVSSNRQGEPTVENAKATTFRRKRISSALPVPRPLASSVAAGVFGHEENGKPIRPKADEVREITEQHAERMMEMTDAELSVAVTTYAKDFGPKPASQLERYVRRCRDAEHSR